VLKFHTHNRDYATLGKVLRKDGSWTDWTGSFYGGVALKGFKPWNDLSSLQDTLGASRGPSINGIHDLSRYAPSSEHSAQFVRHSPPGMSSPTHYPSHQSYWRRAPTEGSTNTPSTYEVPTPVSASGASPAQDGFPPLPARDSPSRQQLQSVSLSNRQRCFLPTKSRPSTPNSSGGYVLTVDGKLQPSAGPSLLDDGTVSWLTSWPVANQDANSNDIWGRPNPEMLKALNMDVQMSGDPSSSSFCCDEVTLGNLNVIGGINDIWSDLGFDGAEWL
jgi:hypothetical protein